MADRMRVTWFMGIPHSQRDARFAIVDYSRSTLRKQAVDGLASVFFAQIRGVVGRQTAH
jgi:hypothetical protein